MKKPNILDRAIMTMAPVHAAKRAAARAALSAVSYTHLTLPTILLV